MCSQWSFFGQVGWEGGWWVGIDKLNTKYNNCSGLFFFLDTWADKQWHQQPLKSPLGPVSNVWSRCDLQTLVLRKSRNCGVESIRRDFHMDTEIAREWRDRSWASEMMSGQLPLWLRGDHSCLLFCLNFPPIFGILEQRRIWKLGPNSHKEGNKPKTRRQKG